MAQQQLTQSWADVDGVTVDMLALLAAGGLGKNLILQKLSKLQSLDGGATNRDLIYIDAGDAIHISENRPIVLHSSAVLIAPTGAESITPDADGDNLTIDGAGGIGLTIISGTGNNSNIFFGDSGDNDAGRIQYSNAVDQLRLFTQGVQALQIDSSQNISAIAGDFDVAAGFFSVGGTENLTIAAGVITATQSFITVDTEASASTDDLDTINAPSSGNGTEITILSASGSRDVTLKDNVGNLILAGDFTLTTTSDRIKLIFNGSSWTETSRSTNG